MTHHRDRNGCSSRIRPCLHPIPGQWLWYLTCWYVRARSSKFSPFFGQTAYLVTNAYGSSLNIGMYIFYAVYLSLSVSVRQRFPWYAIIWFTCSIVGDVSDCGDSPCRNSAFDDGHLWNWLFDHNLESLGSRSNFRTLLLLCKWA